nr:hypothetical protein [Bacteroidales bacterium]
IFNSLFHCPRIQVKLYCAFPQEQMLWSEVFTSEMSDILYLYNQVTKNIADEIQLSLEPEMESALGESRKIDPEAYDAYLKGHYYWEKLNPEAMTMAQEYFMKAIEKEPESVTLPKTYKYLNKALELDPNSAQAHYVKAIDCLEKDFEMRDMSMTYISTNVYLYDQLKDNPRYKELLRKINLSFDE